jgi:hypothetical protein
MRAQVSRPETKALIANAKACPRRGDERGAAVVELAISVVLLFTLLFGIITFGYILSFKQGMTQAAAEGARAAAVLTTGYNAAAETAVNRSVTAYNQTCGSGASPPLKCEYTLLQNTNPNCLAPKTCLEVKLTYDYKNHPLLPPIPLLGGLLPDTLHATSVTEVGS